MVSATMKPTVCSTPVGQRRPTGSIASSMRPAHGGLGDVAEQQRRHRDAELRAGQLEVEVAHRPERDPGPGAAVLGHRLELRAPAGHERELDGHEERRWRRAAPSAEEQAADHVAARPRATAVAGRAGAAPRWPPAARRSAATSTSPPVVVEALARPRGCGRAGRARSRPASRSRRRAPRSRRRRRPRRGAASRRAATCPGRSSAGEARGGRSCSSSISPTSSSSTSSRVMIPAVPPCSSTTTARWVPVARAGRRAGRPRSPGLGHDERRLPSGRSRAWSAASANGTRYTSFTWTTPRTSSRSAPTTGKREWPVATACAASSADGVLDGEARRRPAAAPARRPRPCAEADRPGEQREGLRLERALLARAADEQLELLERAHRRELLLRLDAEPAHGPVGRAVEERDERAEDAAR